MSHLRLWALQLAMARTVVQRLDAEARTSVSPILADTPVVSTGPALTRVLILQGSLFGPGSPSPAPSPVRGNKEDKSGMPGLESRSLALGFLSNTEREADGLGSTVREGGGGASGDPSSKDFMVRRPLPFIDSYHWFAWDWWSRISFFHKPLVLMDLMMSKRCVPCVQATMYHSALSEDRQAGEGGERGAAEALARRTKDRIRELEEELKDKERELNKVLSRVSVGRKRWQAGKRRLSGLRGAVRKAKACCRLRSSGVLELFPLSDPGRVTRACQSCVCRV